MAILAMKKGLRTFYFTYSLDKKHLKCSELLTHAQKYIHMEEGDRTWKELDGKPQKKQTHAEPSRAHVGKSNPPGQQDTKSKVIVDKNDKYTPLLTSKPRSLWR